MRGKKIRSMPLNERPREKLWQKGVKCLSDVELLAVLLGSGNRRHNVLSLAEKVLQRLDRHWNNPAPDALLQIEGVGPAKAALIAAALEFSRRRIRPEGIKINLPTDALPLLQHIADRKQEHFICISLNGANEVIAVRTVSIGLLDQTQVHPREVFADPITDRAAAIIVAHNHPSGNLLPSTEDKQMTRRLRAAAETLGIKLLDHIIFNRKGHFSFLEHRL